MLNYECTDSVDDIAQVLITSIELNKMRVVAHINGQANAAKIGKTVPGDQILEVFRPDFAVRVWQACKPAGMDIPLRIHIYENAAGMTVVAFRTATETFAPYANAELSEIGKELDTIFTSILQAVVVDEEELADG
ncbi:MAG: DUF302 domain-containing protein [Gammaproteobacteria bacterium]|nr:DUF302 domain-containing protein [Gammaproteobacteria bacterium]